METCQVIPITNVTIAEPLDEGITERNDAQSEVDSSEVNVEILREIINEKNDLKKSPSSLTNKNVKIKKIKTKKIRGEKRKFSEKADPCKKVKRKKKEEKSTSDESLPVEEPKEEDEVLVIATIPSTPSVKKEENADPETVEGQTQQKPKQLSSRKSKAVENACRETLEALLKLELETLASMDKSFKILKSLSLLNNRLVPIDTLIDLVEVALETSKASDVVDTEKEMSLSRIVSKLKVEMCSVGKGLKARRSILGQGTDSPKNKSATQTDLQTGVLSLREDDETKENNKGQEEENKLEDSEIVLESEKNPEQTVEKSGKNFCITNYFKKLKKTVEERDKNERFSCFTAKADMFIAPKLGGELTGDRREKFELEFNSQASEVLDLFLKYREKSSLDRKIRKKSKPEVEKLEEVDSDSQGVIVVCESATGEIVEKDHQKKIIPLKVDQPVSVSRTKAKLLQFHDNRRPPYWGTWRRKSETVSGKNPFAQDKTLNYEVDSDDEWEEEEEPGESLHGSDDEKEPEEDYEVDNDFFVPHGYLSDDENPEKENMSPQKKLDLLEKQFTIEQKEKTRKMTPLVFGTFWVEKGGGLPEGSIYQHLQIQNLQMVPWSTIPIEIIEESDSKTEAAVEGGELTSQTKKHRTKATFPNEEIPHLIKMIHGSPQNGEILAKRFLLYWNAEKVQDSRGPVLTKICVLKKIKELATWQASLDKVKRWHVPAETRKEFGAEAESPAKKPRKCFVWKFVKKGEKGAGGATSPSGNPQPEIIMLES